MSRKPVRVLIDSDPLVYRVGFAVQETWYRLHWADVDLAAPDDPLSDTDRWSRFRYKWRLDEFCRLQNLHEEEITVKPYVIHEPLSHALHVMREQVENILKAVKAALADYPEFAKRPIKPELYLSGSLNFRDQLATIRGYKANRDRTRRPVWYKEIRDYLVEQWGAIIVEGYEADDAVAMEQFKAGDEYDVNSIIATIDKDLKMVPGWHYNTLTAQDYLVTRDEALRWFYFQLLTGDATDNIPGLYRIGEKKAATMLPVKASEAELYQIVQQAYNENYAKYKDNKQARERNFGPHQCATTLLLENARLLHMLEHDDQLWTPPGLNDGSIKSAGLLVREDQDEF